MRQYFQIAMLALCVTLIVTRAADSKGIGKSIKEIKGDAAKVGATVSQWADGLVKKSFGGGTWHSCRVADATYIILDLHPTSGIHSSQVTVYKLSGTSREVVLEIPLTPRVTRQYALRESFLEIHKLDHSGKKTTRSLELRVKLP